MDVLKIVKPLFQDIELSKEINESFKQSSQARTKLPSGIEMSVHVLTTGWVVIVHCLHNFNFGMIFLGNDQMDGLLAAGIGQPILPWMFGCPMNSMCIRFDGMDISS